MTTPSVTSLDGTWLLATDPVSELLSGPSPQGYDHFFVRTMGINDVPRRGGSRTL